MSKCVFMQEMLKSRCKFITLLGEVRTAKTSWLGGLGHFFRTWVCKVRGPRKVNGNVSRGTLTASREKRKNRTLPHSTPTVVLAECLILEEV